VSLRTAHTVTVEPVTVEMRRWGHIPTDATRVAVERYGQTFVKVCSTDADAGVCDIELAAQAWARTYGADYRPGVAVPS